MDCVCGGCWCCREGDDPIMVILLGAIGILVGDCECKCEILGSGEGECRICGDIECG